MIEVNSRGSQCGRDSTVSISQSSSVWLYMTWLFMDHFLSTYTSIPPPWDFPLFPMSDHFKTGHIRRDVYEFNILGIRYYSAFIHSSRNSDCCNSILDGIIISMVFHWDAFCSVCCFTLTSPFYVGWHSLWCLAKFEWMIWCILAPICWFTVTSVKEAQWSHGTKKEKKGLIYHF